MGKPRAASSIISIKAFLALATSAWLAVFSATQYALHQSLTMPRHHTKLAPLSPTQQHRRRLEFVHITKTGGSAIESLGFEHGIRWGACHYVSVPAVGCDGPDMNYTAPDFQSYQLTSPWHAPPQMLQQLVNDAAAPFKQHPYLDADLFAVVRNPYDRVVSEYYCPWRGFHRKYGKQHFNNRKDIGDPANLNWWVQDMIRQLQAALQLYRSGAGTKRKVQRKGFNEDPDILAQKHYLNQVEYIFDADDSVVIKNVLHYENISAEFDALMEKYGLEGLHLPPKESGGVYTTKNNSGKGRLTYKDLDAQSIRVINQFARQDFEKLGYVMVESGVLGDSYSLEAKVMKL